MQKQNIEQQVFNVNRQIDGWKHETLSKEKHIFGGSRQKEKSFKQYVDTHRHEFKGDVYGPIVQEMTVNNDMLARFLNAVIGPSQFYVKYITLHYILFIVNVFQPFRFLHH